MKLLDHWATQDADRRRARNPRRWYRCACGRWWGRNKHFRCWCGRLPIGKNPELDLDDEGRRIAALNPSRKEWP